MMIEEERVQCEGRCSELHVQRPGHKKVGVAVNRSIHLPWTTSDDLYRSPYIKTTV